MWGVVCCLVCCVVCGVCVQRVCTCVRTVEQVGGQRLQVLVVRESGHHLRVAGGRQAEHGGHPVQQAGPHQEADQPIGNHLQHGDERRALRGQLQSNRRTHTRTHVRKT